MALLLLALALIYLPDVGHGFIRDDFMWVRAGRVQDLSDLGRIVTGNVGFYRPMVTATFAVNYAMFGLSPFPYALTNLGLLIACAFLVARLARAMGLAPAPALASAALWAFNFHGVNMALLWISGRTALLLCMFALLAVLAAMRERWWLAGLWTLLAVLSKEEALVLPFVIVLWTWRLSGDRSAAGFRRIVRRAMPACAALAVYAVLRLNSGAFGPMNAPSYYQLTASPALLLRNAAEYLDRACSFPAAIVLLTALATRVRPAFSSDERRRLAFSVLWFAAGFALTIFLPVRSSLYALFPSIGSCLAAGVMVQALERAAPTRARYALATFVAVPFLLLPVYRVRNERWVAPADVSRTVVRDLQAAAPVMRAGGHVVAIDDPDEPVALESVFDGLFADAVTLYVGRGCTGELTDAPPPAPGEGQVEILRFVAGRLLHEPRLSQTPAEG